jgi:hypothetical protein
VLDVLERVVDCEINDFDVAQRRPEFVGLRNYNATCYINSVLQVLFALPPFVKQLIAPREDSPLALTLMRALFAEMAVTCALTVDPADLIAQLRVNGAPIDVREQRDAAEFLDGLLQELPVEMRKLFELRTRTTVEGVDVPFLEASEGELQVLSVPIPPEGGSLADALKAFAEKEHLNGDNCKRTDDHGEFQATAITRIIQPPEVIVVQLLRFKQDVETQTRQKDETPLVFENRLNLRPLLCDDADCSYNLVGFILHRGSVDRGHYQAVVPRNDDLFLINDGAVTPKASLDELFDADLGQAYLLFFSRAHDQEPEALDPIALLENNYPQLMQETRAKTMNYAHKQVLTAPFWGHFFRQQIQRPVLQLRFFFNVLSHTTYLFPECTDEFKELILGSTIADEISSYLHKRNASLVLIYARAHQDAVNAVSRVLEGVVEHASHDCSVDLAIDLLQILVDSRQPFRIMNPILRIVCCASTMKKQISLLLMVQRGANQMLVSFAIACARNPNSSFFNQNFAILFKILNRFSRADSPPCEYEGLRECFQVYRKIENTKAKLLKFWTRGSQIFGPVPET